MRGDLTIGQIRVIAALVIDRHVALFGEHEAGLIPSFTSLSVDETRIAMTAWRAMADALSDTPPEEIRRRELHHSPTLGNRWHTSGGFDPEGGAIIDAALTIADAQELESSAAQRRGDALVAICRHFLDHQQAVSGRRNRPHLNIIVRADTLFLGSDDFDGPAPYRDHVFETETNLIMRRRIRALRNERLQREGAALTN